MSDEQFIQLSVNLPKHQNELSIAENIIEKLKLKFKTIVDDNDITGNNHKALYEETVRILDYVGRLSMSAFNLETKLEEMYLLKYQHSPQLAKQLWLEHYETIHQPYNKLKNRCFKLLDDLDREYQRKFKRNPPNWNI